jgi:hypothetical protein
MNSLRDKEVKQMLFKFNQEVQNMYKKDNILVRLFKMIKGVL